MSLVAVVACGLFGPADDLDRLELQRRLWQAQGMDDYSYTTRRECFCLPEWTKPTEVVVVDGEVAGVVIVESGESVPKSRWDAYDTVPGLFDLIERAIEDDRPNFEVRYHEELHYPTYITFGIWALDGGIAIYVEDLARIALVQARMAPKRAEGH